MTTLVKKSTLGGLAATLLLCGGLSVQPVQAGLSFNPLLGVNDLVDVAETGPLFGQHTFFFGGGYMVDVLDPSTQLYGFAVSVGGINPQAKTTQADWTATTLTPGEWDAGAAMGAGFTTADVGSFVDLFGEDPLVNLFWVLDEDETLNDTFDWDGPFDGGELDDGIVSTITFGWDEGTLSSEFVAFDNLGNIIDSSLPQQASTAAVPEPATVVLLGTGLVGLVGYRWRRRNAA